MQKENVKVVVKLVCFPGEFLSGVSRFFVSDGKTSVRSKIGRCRFFRRPQDRQNTDFNVGLTPDLYANLRCSPYRSGVNPTSNKGFTLIELLVVVLIIGILAAVAVPQYQKAVEKSRATEAITLLKSVYQAADAYYMANGEWPLTFDELNIEIPWKGTVKADTNHYGAVRSNSDWSLQIQNNSSNIQDIIIVRLTGKYKGGGFIMSKKSDSSLVPPDTLLCYEQWSGNYAISEHGMFCHKLFHGTKIVHGTTSANYTFIQ